MPVVTPTICVARAECRDFICDLPGLLPSVVGHGGYVGGGSSVRVLKGGHITLEDVNGPHNTRVCLGVLLTECRALMAEEGVHDGTLFWHFHFWITAQVTFIDVANQFINAVDMINERDDGRMFPVQDLVTHCISNVGYVLHLFKIEPYARHPTIVGFVSILFVMLIRHSVPEDVSLTCDAVGPVTKGEPAVVGGLLDLPLLHNSTDELRDGVVHCLFNFMNGLVWDDFSEYSSLPVVSDAFYPYGIGQTEPARSAGDRIVQRVLWIPSSCLVERERFFPSLPFWLDFRVVFRMEKT